MERLEKVESCSQNKKKKILGSKQPKKYGAEYVGGAHLSVVIFFLKD